MGLIKSQLLKSIGVIAVILSTITILSGIAMIVLMFIQ